MDKLKRAAAFAAIIPPSCEPVCAEARQQAPVNIALIKYWGKRDRDLNLPMTDSISIALQKYTATVLRQSGSGRDEVFLNGAKVDPGVAFYLKLVEFVSHARPSANFHFHVETFNDVATGSGLASSASGFAALAKALDQFFGWQLSLQQLSRLARLGSGSASRSLYSGLVHWQKGIADSGEDSFASPLPYVISDLMLGIVLVSGKEKEISSRVAMERTAMTSPLYDAWPGLVDRHMRELQQLFAEPSAFDFARFGAICEQNALSMHATMMGAQPPVLYWLPQTVEVLRACFRFREANPSVPLYATMDAGPNVKLLFRKSDVEQIRALFPNVDIAAPLWSLL